MENNDFAILSYNVKGLRRDKIKRNKIFSYTKEKVKKGIILLQETHSETNDYTKWKHEFDGDIFLNHGSTNSKGTLIALTKNFNYKKISYNSDNDGRIQILTLIYEEKKYLIVNIYNENIESKQVILLKKLYEMLNEIHDILDFEIICGGDLNFFFDDKIDAEGGKKEMKIASISEITKLNGKFSLCDIFRVRNPGVKRFSFRQKNRNRVNIQRRLDYFLVSSSLQN